MIKTQPSSSPIRERDISDGLDAWVHDQALAAHAAPENWIEMITKCDGRIEIVMRPNLDAMEIGSACGGFGTPKP